MGDRDPRLGRRNTSKQANPGAVDSHDHPEVSVTHDGLSPRSRTEPDDGERSLKVRRSLLPLGRAIRHPLADYGFLLGCTMLLLIVGLIMVLSASTVMSFRNFGSSYTLVSRQAMFALAGVIAMMVLSKLPVDFYRRMAYPALIASGVSLILVLVPGIGVEVNGQRNWISLGGPFRIQPSEFAKLAIILWVANLLYSKKDSVDGWKSLLVPLMPVVGAFVFLILMEGDLGTTLVIMPIVGLMLLVAGAPLKLFAWLGGGVLAGIALMSVTVAYRLQRFQTWLDPASDPTGAGWQVLHGQYALATGGWWGVGLGASREKWGFLPEAQTDFILAVIGEELGLMGTLSVLGIFAAIAYITIQMATRAENMFVRLAITGVAVWIVAQALINIGAVVGALPITGLPLPLVSYGGSSLMFTLMAVGMLLAFARGQPRAAEFLEHRSQTRRMARKISNDRPASGAAGASKTKVRPRRKPGSAKVSRKSDPESATSGLAAESSSGRRSAGSGRVSRQRLGPESATAKAEAKRARRSTKRRRTKES